MNSSYCNYCGSVNLIADRALGGKLICRDCGRPVSKIKYFKPPLIMNRTRYLIFIFGITILLVIIIL